ncbi:MAG TPA: anti-phage dCTP deaminase [Candidatus Limnocylindrales bacterium]|nr:anti-phage dCTP deaminase [Candidatus Limnocylindrales bacterium]
MGTSEVSLFATANSELIIGLVAPIGCNRDFVTSVLRDLFAVRRYEVNTVKLSDDLPNFAEILGVPIEGDPYFNRVNSYMTAGNELRRRSGYCNALVLSAVFNISERRAQATEDIEDPDPTLPRHVHVLDSLKRPEEVRTLRQIYGPGFYLIGAFAPRNLRKRHLQVSQGLSEEQAEKLLRRDEDEEEDKKFGQQTRDTFHLSDVFIDVSSYESTQAALHRFLDLVFGNPFHTPTLDEFGMHAAFGASIRSGALARQIGAALIAETGDLIGVGHNEVPRPGGGLYSAEDNPDMRDLAIGFDSNTARLRVIAARAAEALREQGLVDDVEKATRVLSESKLRDITEYGRTVHAEMEALLSAARVGVSVRNAVLYTTTFPCHNCARHAVAAGVKRIVYIEPYPKSEALPLHGDAIHHAGEDSAVDAQAARMVLGPFLGVAPRRYGDLFSMVRSDGVVLSRKDEEGNRVELPTGEASHPRTPMLPIAYPVRELLAVAALDELRQKLEEDEADVEAEP